MDAGNFYWKGLTAGCDANLSNDVISVQQPKVFVFTAQRMSIDTECYEQITLFLRAYSLPKIGTFRCKEIALQFCSNIVLIAPFFRNHETVPLAMLLQSFSGWILTRRCFLLRDSRWVVFQTRSLACNNINRRIHNHRKFWKTTSTPIGWQLSLWTITLSWFKRYLPATLDFIWVPFFIILNETLSFLCMQFVIRVYCADGRSKQQDLDNHTLLGETRAILSNLMCACNQLLCSDLTGGRET